MKSVLPIASAACGCAVVLVALTRRRRRGEARARRRAQRFDYLEIGTSDFHTEAERSPLPCLRRGLSIEPIGEYFDRLPAIAHNRLKLQCAVSSVAGVAEMHFIPSHVRRAHELPQCLDGCNSLHRVHPQAERVRHLVEAVPVAVLTFGDVCRRCDVGRIGLLKVDAEGHDAEILESMIAHCDASGGGACFPALILFESRGHGGEPQREEAIVATLRARGYEVLHQGCDTVLSRRVAHLSTVKRCHREAALKRASFERWLGSWCGG